MNMRQRIVAVVAWPYRRIDERVDRLPTWFSAVLLAIAWAVAVYAVYFGIIVGPAATWSLDEKLSLGQTATALAGVGGGFVALLFAGRQLANALGDSRIEVVMFPSALELAVWREHSLSGSVSFELRNNGSSIPQLWQFEVRVPLGLEVTPGSGFTETRNRALGGGFVCHRSDPIFRGSGVPVGEATITPVWVDTGCEFDPTESDSDTYDITVIVTTERGESIARFPVAVTYRAGDLDVFDREEAVDRLMVKIGGDI